LTFRPPVAAGGSPAATGDVLLRQYRGKPVSAEPGLCAVPPLPPAKVPRSVLMNRTGRAVLLLPRPERHDRTATGAVCPSRRDPSAQTTF